MLTLHIANKNYSSWSLRPWVLMKTLGIPFEEKLHPFAPDTNYEAFRAFSPTGKVPCLIDGGTTVWESLAIVEYLAESHPQVWPADRQARAFARSVSAEMHGGFSSLRNICTMNCGLRVELKDVPPALASDIARIDEIWSEGLARFGGPFLAGDSFTAADAFFAPVAFRVQTYGLQLSPAAAAYGERLRALPAMVEWYEAGIAETWREPGHEAEAQAAGTITADLRATA
ncbi:glutathione S-transferase [Devosia geojensis]|uniref:Glutathione S-transferase n=1 Tax=Devosia geojensis TaxID=443610 RepID=A0A0F5FRL0_9HYPH|nr:glutathione S-transferase family protein [Devosia geojensis]KKB10807.1 glutathione S-transferase [Devosia geojensis]